MNQNVFLPIVVAIALGAVAGCDSEFATMRVWGEVSHDGRPIESGQIILIPIEGTSGPSTGGAINAGQYDLSQVDGPRAGGTYRVEITAYGNERSYTPNASGQGPTVVVRQQVLPAKFNRNSTLNLKVSVRAEENRHDFDLK